MQHRTLTRDRAFLECGRCAGVWLAPQLFAALTDAARGGADAAPPSNQPITTDPPPRANPGPFYRRCIVCNATMVRETFGAVSGVSIDICQQHGIWFDAEELEYILRWLRAGGDERTQRQLSERADAEQRRRQRVRIRGSGPPSRLTGPGVPTPSVLGLIFSVLDR